MRVTISAIKADIGGIGGHTCPSVELLDSVKNFVVKNAKGLLIDQYLGYTGDDIHIVMTHTRGVEDEKIHKLAWDAFSEGTKLAKEQGLYGAGQDLLKDSFSGNVKGLGPGVAEIEMEERPSEVFCKFAELKLWQDKAELEAALMYPGRYVVHSVMSADGADHIVSASTDRLHNLAGTYVGKDDPIAIVRTQKNFPATEEAGSSFNEPHYVAGNTRGSHHMPLMPVKLNSAASLNYSIPIVSCLLFSMRNGKLTGPHDGFGTADWDLQTMKAAERAMIMRNQGFIHPATLVPDELEYNKGYEARMSKLQSKFKDLEEIMNGKIKAATTKAAAAAAATKQAKAGSSKL